VPLFDFECPKCKTVIEVLQRYSDDPPEHCDEPMIRVLSGGKVALDFKGTGFYKTDYVAKPTSS
jgi:putative FmdB family regulatory protein